MSAPQIGGGGSHIAHYVPLMRCTLSWLALCRDVVAFSFLYKEVGHWPPQGVEQVPPPSHSILFERVLRVLKLWQLSSERLRAFTLTRRSLHPCWDIVPSILASLFLLFLKSIVTSIIKDNWIRFCHRQFSKFSASYWIVPLFYHLFASVCYYCCWPGLAWPSSHLSAYHHGSR